MVATVAPKSDRGTRALVVVKEGTYPNTTPTPDTSGRGTTPDTKAEGMKFDIEFSDLSMVYTIQEFELEKVNNYPSVKGRLKETLMFSKEHFQLIPQF